MVADRELCVLQNDGYIMIGSQYSDDPPFTLEQEAALHEIARSFLMVNRQAARRKRYAEKKKKERKHEQD